MVRRRCLWAVGGMAYGLLSSSAPAQPSIPASPGANPPGLAERAARRFPQPVRVGDLIGRQVLEPTEAQPVLGRVAAVARRGDGGLDLIVRFGGVLGIGARPIAVPVEAVALLGEHVAVIDFTPEQLGTFPAVDGAGTGTLPPGDTIRVGLVRPFH